MRLFLALNLPPETRAAIHAATEPLRAVFPKAVKWVDEASLHVTLQFFGERDDGFLTAARSALAPLVATQRAPILQLRGIAALPSVDRPRVLWLDIAPNPGVASLYQEVMRGTESLGVPHENRMFRPHVTLGRVRPGFTGGLSRLADVAKGIDFCAEAAILSVDVMESALGPSGARYRLVTAMPFARPLEGS
jgi:2'-5' RNA ligase